MTTAKRWHVEILLDEHDDERRTRAAARTLFALSHELLLTAAVDIQAVAHERAWLHI